MRSVVATSFCLRRSVMAPPPPLTGHLGAARVHTMEQSHAHPQNSAASTDLILNLVYILYIVNN